jgi:hypothetical protein
VSRVTEVFFRCDAGCAAPACRAVRGASVPFAKAFLCVGFFIGSFVLAAQVSMGA